MKEKKKTLLVALGFDNSPEAVLKKGIEVAKDLKARVYVMHVITELPRLDFYFDAYRLWEDFRDSAVDESMNMLKKYIGKVSDEFPGIEPLVEVGDPAAKILEKADEIKIYQELLSVHVYCVYSRY